MDKKLYDYIEITDLKDMLNKTKSIYKDRPAYKIRIGDEKYRIITHEQLRKMVDCLGTALCDLGLKGKRIAIIGENRYEWEIAYLSVTCGTGVVVPLDKALPENELENLIQRSNIEAIFYTSKYEEALKRIQVKNKNNLKYLISMDLEEDRNIDEIKIFSQNSLIKKGQKLLESGNTIFINSQINSDEMGIMFFTSGTTSVSKIVALSHKNICTNLMDLASTLDINESDVFLSNLPIHHVFECTVGFLFAVYKGSLIVFSDGIRHLVDNLKEYKVSVMACVPGIYERIFMMIRKQLEKQGKLEEILEKEEQYRFLSMEEKKKVFKEIHEMIGGNIKLFISGAAALDYKIEEKYRLLGINLVQAYGLTETSPVVAIGTNKYYKTGSIGKSLPNVDAKIVNTNEDGIGELIVKGPSVMKGYYENPEATKEVMEDNWFHTGDLAKMDEDGYIYICGRKKSVIVLKNGKNIFPEEMENLINKIDGIEESFVFGKQVSEDKDNIKIHVKVVFNREKMREIYNVENDEDIYNVIFEKIKEINKIMPKYKAIRGMVITEKPLLKTTTNKIKRQANLDEINKTQN